MSDLAASTSPQGSARPRRWAALGTILVLVPIVGAVVVGGPRVWKTATSDPTASRLAALPAQQPAVATQLPTDRAPKPGPGQLSQLGRFTARDPFLSPLAPAVRAKQDVPAVAPAPATAAAAPATAAAPAAAAAATISVNGVPEAVALQASFPATAPVFRLVATGADEVQISVAADSTAAAAASAGLAGSPEAGGATAASQSVTLVRGHTLTLLDTSSGARYQLRLVSVP
jgi:hypothetical protein